MTLSVLKLPVRYSHRLGRIGGDSGASSGVGSEAEQVADFVKPEAAAKRLKMGQSRRRLRAILVS